jgi:hypothetical protein
VLNPTSVSLIAAVSSSAVAIVLAVANVYERFVRERQQTLERALEYLTGGSQKRSVGVALIEGLWHRRHPYYRAIIPALTNQAVYLLLETESKGRHQLHTFMRIMDLIMRVPPKSFLRNFYIEIIEALQAREDNVDDLHGIDIGPASACQWRLRVEKHSGISSKA